jgi:hypothetical protein
MDGNLNETAMVFVNFTAAIKSPEFTSVDDWNSMADE